MKKSADELIASKHIMKPIENIIREKLSNSMLFSSAFSNGNIINYGPYIAKVPLMNPSAAATNSSNNTKKKGKVVVVTAMTPTKSGEGKTCMSVGLSDALNAINSNGKKTSIVALREPSLGPVFGMKGGAAGGGKSQVVPMDEINLHFTGDMHAITSANNLLSAMIDNHIYFNLDPVLDSRRIEWRRVVDLNDRALRHVVVGLSGNEGSRTANGFVREDGFDITVASEVMAIFCLARNYADLQERLGNIIIGYDRSGKTPIKCKDIGAAGSMTALLSRALLPNIVQSLEGNLAFIHGGPFANIAHGCSSVIATETAQSLADIVVTEAGFGADLGAEKFFNIKCRKTGIKPDYAVIVATVRAIKHHGGANPPTTEGSIEVGMANLVRHIENVRKFGVGCVVGINRFPGDTDADLETVVKLCKSMGGVEAFVCEHYAKGSKGAIGLAEHVSNKLFASDADKNNNFSLLYKDEAPLKEKVTTIAKSIYRASDVAFSAEAAEKLKRFESLGFGNLPVCVAKTQYSFSDNPNQRNAPINHTLHVQDVRLSAGAGFVVVLTGSVMTMPGLPKVPAAKNIGVDNNGTIFGLF